MKILSIASITDSSRFPVKKGTLQFIQDAYKESLADTVKSLIGASYNPATMYVMSGVLNTGTLPVYTFSAGVIFYNGEIFDLDATSFSATGSNVATFAIIQTQYTTDADPVTFTDTTVRNIHNIRKMQLVQGLSGTGLADYGQGYFLNFTIPPQLTLVGAGSAVVSGTYPALTITVPTVGLTNTILYAGSYNVGNVPAVSTDYAISFAAISTAAYYIVGTMISNGVRAQDTNCFWTVSNRTTIGFTLTVNESVAQVQNIAFEFILFAK